MAYLQQTAFWKGRVRFIRTISSAVCIAFRLTDAIWIWAVRSKCSVSKLAAIVRRRVCAEAEAPTPRDFQFVEAAALVSTSGNAWAASATNPAFRRPTAIRPSNRSLLAKERLWNSKFRKNIAVCSPWITCTAGRRCGAAWITIRKSRPLAVTCPCPRSKKNRLISTSLSVSPSAPSRRTVYCCFLEPIESIQQSR